MMRTLITVFKKEALDNVRDRRTLASALIMGPLFGPILFAFVINLSIERSLDDVERVTTLPVIGREHAPNLLRFLESRNIDIIDGPASRDAAIEAVRTGAHDVIVLIPAEFGAQLADSIPARVELITDYANTQADREARRVRGALRAYNQQLASIRLSARGLSPLVLRPLNIDEVDMSTPSGRSVILLGMMSYFFIFALLMGGMYLAIDTTAGERERGSLEPLLALPVTREQLLFGKIAATCLFMALSLALSLTSFYFALKFMPLEQLGMTALIEVHDRDRFDRLTETIDFGPDRRRLLGINNRDLTVQQTDLSTTERLAAALTDKPLLVSESGIKTRADVERVVAAGADAILVGEALLRADDAQEAIRKLLPVPG